MGSRDRRPAHAQEIISPLRQRHDRRSAPQAGDQLRGVRLLRAWPGCILLPMSFRPVRKIAGIGNVFLGAELVDIAEYDLEIYEENPEVPCRSAPDGCKPASG